MKASHTYGGRTDGTRWMQAMRIALYALLALPPISARAADEIDLELRANRERIYIGESVIVHLTVSGSQVASTPDFSGAPHLDTEVISTRDASYRSFVFVNGTPRRESFIGRKYVIRVTPRESGTVQLGPVRVTIDGRTYSTPGPDIQVQEIAQQHDVLLEIEPSSSEVLPGETFSVTFRLLLRRLEGRYAAAEPLAPRAPAKLEVPFLDEAGIDGLTGPDPPIKEFLQSKLADRSAPGLYLNSYTVSSGPFRGIFDEKEPAKFAFGHTGVRRNGIGYFQYQITVEYRAEKLGDYTFGPAVFRGPVINAVSPEGSASVEEYYAIGPAATVRVVQPPDEGRPASYIGVLGAGLTVDAELDAQTCNIGDPLTLTVRVSGPGKYDSVRRPLFSEQPDLTALFRVADDRVQLTRTDDGVTYQVPIRPTSAGTFEVPPIEVGYFDLTERSYQVATSHPLPIRVNETEEIGLENLIGSPTNVAEQTHGEIGSAGGVSPAPVRVRAAGAAPAVLPVYALLATAAVGPVLFGLVGLGQLWRRRRRSRPARPRATVDGTARAVSDACARAAHPQAAAQEALLLVRHYAASLFPTLAPGATTDDLERAMRDAAVPNDVAEAFSAWVREAEAAAYRHDVDTQTIEALFEQTGTHLQRLSEALPQRRSGPRVPLALYLALLLPAVSEATPGSDAFGWSHANALLANAEEAPQFLEAARAYQRMAETGIRNGHLFLNQGTALLLAGRPEDAVRVLSRAERYLGYDPEVRRNLRLAVAESQGADEGPLGWHRVLLFWHYGLSMRARAWITAGLFVLTWLAATLRFTRIAPWRPLAVVCAIACALMGTSLATSLHQESQDLATPPDLRPAEMLPQAGGPS